MANDGFYRTALIGGDPAAVDGIDGDDVVDKDLILAMVSNILYVYEVDADSAAAESSPDVIAFDANGGDKRAVLKAALAGTGASRFPGEIALIGGQIAFPATAVPSADANTLDDYEEGTFDVDLLFGGAKVGITYSFGNGHYTKVGRKVTCICYFALSSKGTSTGTATLANYPFTVVNSAGADSAGSIGYSVAVSFADRLYAFMLNNTTTLSLSETTNAGTPTVLDDTNFANTSRLMINITYFTA